MYTIQCKACDYTANFDNQDLAESAAKMHDARGYGRVHETTEAILWEKEMTHVTRVSPD